MTININPDTRLSDIKKQFSDVYPYLKIEFFKRPHAKHKLSSETDRIISDKPMASLAKAGASAAIDINGKRTVLQVEQDFWDLFGLSVQVFRKAMNMWIETSFTDSWTLESQNSEGHMFSTKEFGGEEDQTEDRKIDMD
jgi:hypothetical protein